MSGFERVNQNRHERIRPKHRGEVNKTRAKNIAENIDLNIASLFRPFSGERAMYVFAKMNAAKGRKDFYPFSCRLTKPDGSVDYVTYLKYAWSEDGESIVHNYMDARVYGELINSREDVKELHIFLDRLSPYGILKLKEMLTDFHYE